MALEGMRSPPPGVEYSLVTPSGSAPTWLRSPIKGFMRRFESSSHDLMEAVLSPIITRNLWVYSLATFAEPMAFQLLRVPTPRMLRWSYLRRMFLSDNFRAFLFWSEWGRKSLGDFAGPGDQGILAKAHVVYPAVLPVPEHLRPDGADVRHILFSGDFFRKGGVNVVDAFLRLLSRYPDLRLVVCCDPVIDFGTRSPELKARYLDLITNHPNIDFIGRVSRERMLTEILPRTHIYLIPTYAEAFGFAVLEAMAYGIPVVSTNICAMPEIIEDGANGYAIDVAPFDVERKYRSYVVNEIDDDFREYLTDSVYARVAQLIEGGHIRASMSQRAISDVATRFSFENRNRQLKVIYTAAVGQDRQD
jgi:glycosyltransferase involved in cell wall biosynthesis